MLEKGVVENIQDVIFSCYGHLFFVEKGTGGWSLVVDFLY